MLIEFYGQNFGCFRDEFRLSMLATDIDPDSDRGIVAVKVQGDDEPLRLLRAAAIYGANASGKSTVLRAAGVLRSLIRGTGELPSDSALQGYEPFGFSTEKTPVRLGITAVVDGAVYDYEVQFFEKHFSAERLRLLHANEEPTELLDRHGQDVSGKWTSDPQFSLISQSFRPNALLLSLADRLAPALAKDITIGLSRLLGTLRSYFPFGIGEIAAQRAHTDQNFADWLAGRLKSADFGVIDMRPEEFEIRRPVFAGRGTKAAEFAEGFATEKAYRLSLVHGTSEQTFVVPYNLESGGTRRMIEIAPLFYDLAHAERPIAAFVDELHESLHPKLLEAVIREFNCDTPMNQVRGQLIFATHETALLDGEAWTALLRRDQIYLTEKDASGAARLYSVAEFKERNNLNIRRRYLQGRYGALPSLGAFSD